MREAPFVRHDERAELADAAPPVIDPSPLLGKWINTYAATTAVASLTISRVDGDVVLRIRPANAPPAAPWHEARAEALYATGVRSSAATAVVATYDSECIVTRLEANLSQGLLVVATFHRFKDTSSRSNHFVREFFHYAEDAPTDPDPEAHAWMP